MKKKFIILGCGSSVGVPRIDGHWGNCEPNNKKNDRILKKYIDLLNINPPL